MYIYLSGLTKNVLIAQPMRLIYVGSPKKGVIAYGTALCACAGERALFAHLSILWVQRQGNVCWTRLHKRRISTTW